MAFPSCAISQISNLKSGETTLHPTDPGTSSIDEPVGLLKSLLPFYCGASLLFSIAFTYAIFDIKKRIRRIGG
jgi:phosphatidylglycerophosphatase A